MLFNNFNVTQDIQSASKRTLKYVKWDDGAAIAVNIIACVMMLIAAVVAIIFLIHIKSPIVSYSNPFSVT